LIGMVELSTNVANGHGYRYEVGGQEPDFVGEFSDDVEAILELAIDEGNCLVEGSPGSGKSHLARELGTVARRTYDVATLTFYAHINGGSKRGVDNALLALDSFSENHGNDGLIIVDNLDYYGKSSNGKANRRSHRTKLAKVHTTTAGYIKDLVSDDGAPVVLGLAHNQEWRDNQWNFDKTLGSEDSITPTAQALLEAFTASYQFEGNLKPEAAYRILVENFDRFSALSIVQTLISSGHLNHCVVSNIDAKRLSEHGIRREVRSIIDETRRKIGSLSLDRTHPSS
jgi:hypothetical protein